MRFHDILENEVLPEVTKPSRYLGTEFNAVRKDASAVALRMALVFPDLYDLGLGNLGLHILYAVANRLPWCWAERAYAPGPDLEAALRVRGLPLFALESKDPLGAMDLLGFSLQSELTYTSVLNILDLSGLPLRSEDRGKGHPLVFAGGPATVNPEPMAPFMDFFVLGDGEEAIVEVAEVARGMRGRPRDETLQELAKLPGVYVPALYPFEVLAGGTRVPCETAPKILRRLVSNLDLAPYPVDHIVPFTQLIHDRIGLEVMRGCTHGCRFCQAGMVNRPVRIRSVDGLMDLMDAAVSRTGYEEVSLLSLSTCDYPHIRTLLHTAATRGQEQRVAVSLPSLRLDTFSVELADAVTGMRRSGLTFAPEAATPRLRAVINKWCDEDDVLAVATEAYKRGWHNIKLYFMIGLPTERDEDVEAIADLCERVEQAGRAVTGRARVSTGVSTFVPKPFTPFQWEAQIDLEETRRRQDILFRRLARKRGIKYGRHEPEASFIEGLLSRGDRRAADLLEAAFRRGARLDTSSEYLDFDAWQAAVEETGYDVANALRARDPQERLPWDHIDVRIPKQWFQLERQRAMELKETTDCRWHGCKQCGLRAIEPGLCRAVHDEYRASRDAEAREQLARLEERVEPPAVQRLRFRIGRRGASRFLSNLEMMSAWVRALRRAGAALSYSQGFHAHPKVTFATAPPVGEESEGDLMDAVLWERVEPEALLERLRAAVPEGFAVFGVEETALDGPALMSTARGFAYTLYVEGDLAALQQRVRELLASPNLFVERRGRPERRGRAPKTRRVDIRPALAALEARPADGDTVAIDFTTVAHGPILAKPKEVLEALGSNPLRARIVKRETLLA